VLRTFLHDLRQLVDSGTKTAAIACSICFRIAVDPQFQVGDKSKEECCRLLSRACELGLTSYRGLMHRFFEVMSQPITVDLGKEWLMEAAHCGSFFAVETLRTDFPALYRQYQHNFISDPLSTRPRSRLSNANDEHSYPIDTIQGVLSAGSQSENEAADSNRDSDQTVRDRDMLLTYCRSGNYFESRKLLIEGSSAIPESGDGVTPLHWLVSFHAEEEIEDLAGLMLNNGALLASWECETENDFWLGKVTGTPLLWAVWYRNIHAVRTLTRLDQSPEPENVNGAFMLAATMHFFDVLEILLLWFAKIRQNNLGAALDVGSLLEGAADGVFFVQRLLRHGIQVKDFAMRATFDLLLAMPSLPAGHMMHLTNRAVLFNNSSLLVYLLRRQSPAERLRNVKLSIILYPIIRSYWGVFSVLTDDEFQLIHPGSLLPTSGPQETTHSLIQLPVIARQRDLAYLKRIIQLGCPIDQRSDKPKPTGTAFTIAVINGLYDSATLLLRYGANKDQLCGVMGGTTPIWEILFHWPDVPISRLQYLLEEVPKAGFGHVSFICWPSVGGNLVYPFAMTPWADYKAGFRISETLKYLLSKLRDKSCLDLIDKFGMTALSTAAMNGNVEVCQSLLEMGVNVNAGAIAPLNRAQDFLKQFQKREKKALSKGSYGERKLAIHIRKRAEAVVNMLLARDAINSSHLDTLNYISSGVSSGNMRIPPAEVGDISSTLYFVFRLTYCVLGPVPGWVCCHESQRLFLPRNIPASPIQELGIHNLSSHVRQGL
jgi:ankyrin repeat protein